MPSGHFKLIGETFVKQDNGTGSASLRGSAASTPSDVQLAPCPFCGSAMKTGHHPINPLALCPTRGCPGAWQSIPLDDPRQVVAWNRRADPVRDGLVAALHQTINQFDTLCRIGLLTEQQCADCTQFARAALSAAKGES